MKKINFNLKNLLSKKKKLKKNYSLDPHKQWGIIVKVFFGIVILLIFFSLFMLYQIKNDQIFQATPTIQDSNPSIKQDLLKKTEDLFNNKSVREKEVKENRVIFKDPSL